MAASALLWLYLLGRLMVAAPVLNATLWQRKHDSPSTGGEPPAGPSPSTGGEPAAGTDLV